MTIAVWIVSGLLAALYLTAGLMKTLRPKAALRAGLPWVEDYASSTVKLIGTTELLGAFGLILPWLTGIAEVLTPLAATGLVVIQALAIGAHLRRGERDVLAFNVALLAAAAFVAVARFAGL
ncbi:DoxX family protein [Cellulomonas soli]|uniref:DoxX family protein n=1 Tax=Cellulomonas soli TaxID=931535 RepID=UPI003F848E32